MVATFDGKPKVIKYRLTSVGQRFHRCYNGYTVAYFFSDESYPNLFGL